MDDIVCIIASDSGLAPSNSNTRLDLIYANNDFIRYVPYGNYFLRELHKVDQICRYMYNNRGPSLID